MELFTRDLVLAGPPSEVRAWAGRIAEAYGGVTGKQPAVWVSIAGGTVGHHTWSMPVEGTGEIVDLSMQVLQDADYLAAVEEGRPFFQGAPKDSLYRPFVGTPAFETEVGNVCLVTAADAKAGHIGDAVGWGLEMAQHVTQLTGIEQVLLGNAAGSYSRLTWMGVAQDAREADQADRRARADDGYQKLIARGGGLFADRSGRSQWFLRIA